MCRVLGRAGAPATWRWRGATRRGRFGRPGRGGGREHGCLLSRNPSGRVFRAFPGLRGRAPGRSSAFRGRSELPEARGRTPRAGRKLPSASPGDAQENRVPWHQLLDTPGQRQGVGVRFVGVVAVEHGAALSPSLVWTFRAGYSLLLRWSKRNPTEGMPAIRNAMPAKLKPR